MADGQKIVELDLRELTQFADQLRTAGPRIIAEAWKTLSAWGEEYKRRAQRVTPIETGHARRSWQLVRDKGNLQVVIGNSAETEDGVSYLKFLEYGTDRIAGGRVKAWREGMEPVMEWPAKMGDIPNFRSTGKGGAGREGTARFERAVSVATAAFTAGTGEQMPILRPIGYEIAPQIADDLKQAVREGFESLRNKGGGTP